LLLLFCGKGMASGKLQGNKECELGAGKNNRRGKKAKVNGKLVDYGTVNVYNLISA